MSGIVSNGMSVCGPQVNYLGIVNTVWPSIRGYVQGITVKAREYTGTPRNALGVEELVSG